MNTKAQGKGEMTPQETEPDLPASVGGSPMDVWVNSDLPCGWGYWQQHPLLASFLLEVTINPVRDPVDLRAGSPQAKQITGREPNSTHQ